MADEEESGWGGTDPAVVALNARKYAEEDVDDVKASWEDEDEEPAAPPPPVDNSASTSKKKKDKKTTADDTEPERELTEEERKQAQLESDLAMAKETFGITDEDLSASLDQLKPKTAEDFKELQRRLMLKLSDLKKSKHFSDFVSDLIKSLCQEVNLETSKRINKEVLAHVQALEKIEKEKEKKNKSKAKVTLKKIRPGDELDTVDDFGGAADFVDEDDFM